MPENRKAESLRELQLSWIRFDAHARVEGLSGKELAILVEIAARSAPTPHQLSDLFALTTGSMTVVLDRLERKGFARRDRNPEDRRGLLLSPTAAGHDVLTRLDAAVSLPISNDAKAEPSAPARRPAPRHLHPVADDSAG
ncbi:MarR family transcriptional regulator [Jatrophihabitans telluris]|uniref:MarR family transcriptional regulator n=1 Tax=Jatrophihabitans telluris TaxID=2038343 RepID=A0ABY4R0I1_9ACTN|nr:MarR family transcriptional regulator [Jatrophihabitans telluris]UQX88569.1 MarR family transcriptional regulator [Jatrophihabitans telluris]